MCLLSERDIEEGEKGEKADNAQLQQFRNHRYCFQNDTTAPFELVDSDDPNELKICWRRDVPRVPSLKANCTGCDCALWTIQKTGNVRLLDITKVCDNSTTPLR